MKFLLLAGVIYLVYRFYQLKDQVKEQIKGRSDFPPEREKEELEDFTDYEELE